MVQSEIHFASQGPETCDIQLGEPGLCMTCSAACSIMPLGRASRNRLFLGHVLTGTVLLPDRIEVGSRGAVFVGAAGRGAWSNPHVAAEILQAHKQ